VEQNSLPRLARRPQEMQEDFIFTNTFKRNKDSTYDVYVTLADMNNSTRNTEYKTRDERMVQEYKIGARMDNWPALILCIRVGIIRNIRADLISIHFIHGYLKSVIYYCYVQIVHFLPYSNCTSQRTQSLSISNTNHDFD
jgi:hypothetical protein